MTTKRPEPTSGTPLFRIEKKGKMTDDQFWILARQSLLSFLDALERWRNIEPRTAQMRKWLKSYRLVYPSPPIAGEDVRERVAELEAGRE